MAIAFDVADPITGNTSIDARFTCSAAAFEVARGGCEWQIFEPAGRRRTRRATSETIELAGLAALAIPPTGGIQKGAQVGAVNKRWASAIDGR